MRGLNDNTDLAGGRLFAPSIGPLLVPALIVLLAYGAGLLGLILAGQGDSALARLFIVTLATIPFLVAYAVLRRVTARLGVLPHGIHIEPGFPKGGAAEVPYSLIRALEVKRGFGGRMAGSGTLVVRMANGQSVAVADLASPEAAANAIRAEMAARAAAVQGGEEPENAQFRRVSAR